MRSHSYQTIIMITDHKKNSGNTQRRHEETRKREASAVMEDIELGEVKEEEFSKPEPQEATQQPQRSKKKGRGLAVLVACGIYSFCSVFTVLTNKSLASG